MEADEQALRVPWQTLLSTQRDYLDRIEFLCWASCVTENAGQVTEILKRELDARCPGFCEAETRYQRTLVGERTFYLRLLVWTENHFFTQPESDHWLKAVTFYSARDPRYLRAHAHAAGCKELWAKAKPASYPSFEQWRKDTCGSRLERVLRPELRDRWAAFSRVCSERLEGALRRYLDWEAFAYWSRSPLESACRLPPPVAAELALRCPGFLEHDARLRPKDPPDFPRSWFRLMDWITSHFFAREAAENWLDAVLISAEHHPRSLRMREYWMEWDGRWTPEELVPYPMFDGWRAIADSFVRLDRP